MSPGLKRAKTCRICVHESQGRGRRIEKIENSKEVRVQTRVPSSPLGSTRWGAKRTALGGEEQGSGDLETILQLPCLCLQSAGRKVCSSMSGTSFHFFTFFFERFG